MGQGMGGGSAGSVDARKQLADCWGCEDEDDGVCTRKVPLPGEWREEKWINPRDIPRTSEASVLLHQDLGSYSIWESVSPHSGLASTALPPLSVISSTTSPETRALFFPPSASRTVLNFTVYKVLSCALSISMSHDMP